MSHSNIICLVALLSLFTVLQAHPTNTYYRPRAQQMKMHNQPNIQFNRPRSEFKEPRKQMESQSHEDGPKPLQQINSKRLHPQNQALVQKMQARISSSMAAAQDLSILNCGAVGNTVQKNITFALNFLSLFRDDIEIDIDCDYYGTGDCGSVIVHGPDYTTQADVDVCVRSSDDVCVTVYSSETAETPCDPASSIDVNLNLPKNGGGTFPISIRVDLFSQCVSLEVKAPICF